MERWSASSSRGREDLNRSVSGREKCFEARAVTESSMVLEL